MQINIKKKRAAVRKQSSDSTISLLVYIKKIIKDAQTGIICKSKKFVRATICKSKKCSSVGNTIFYLSISHWWTLGFPDNLVGKESTCNAGDPSLIPGSGRSPGEGIGYPLQYSGLENSMDCRQSLGCQRVGHD